MMSSSSFDNSDRDPTPEGVTLLDGIPKFLPYNTVDEFYTAIAEVWTMDTDYTLTYSVTSDELNSSTSYKRNQQLSFVIHLDIQLHLVMKESE